MTLSFSNLNEIGNLYENIAASEQEQLNEDLNDKIKRGLTNQAFGNKPTSPTTPLNLNPGSGDASSLIKTGLDSVKKPTAKPMSFAQTQQTNKALGNAWNEIRSGKKETQTTQQPITQQQTPNTQTSAGAKPQTIAAAGGKGGTVTAGKQYAATLGGQKGNVTYDASGAKKFTPSAATPAKALPSKPAIGTTPGGTKFERRTPTRREMDAAKGAGGGEAGVRAAVAVSKPAASSTLKSATDAAAKPQTAFTPKTPAANSSVGSFKPVNSLQATSAAGSTKAPDPATSFSKTTAATPKPITPNPSASTPAAPAGGYSTKEGDGKLRKDKLFEGVDAYDLVLEYLLDNGHVDTVEEAHYVMMEMPAETIQTIVEGAVGEFADKVASTVGSAVGTVQRAAREIPKYAKQKVDNVAGTYEYARQRADANAPSGSTKMATAKNAVMSGKSSAPRSREFSHGGKSGMTNPGPNFGR
jgi:hypothetical protein